MSADPAGAHVTVDGEVAPGGNGAFTFTVPNERDDATTTQLSVQIPEDVPLGSLRVQPKPGWTIATTTRTLDEPVEVFGEPVTEVVDTITWTADGEGIGIDQFDTFTVRGGPFPEDATEVMFPAIQTYSSGEEVAWIEETVEGEEEPERPAPVLELTAPEEPGAEGADATDATEQADAASGSAGDQAADSEEAAADTDDDGGDTLAIVSLVVGIAGLATAVVALVTARRSTTSTSTTT